MAEHVGGEAARQGIARGVTALAGAVFLFSITDAAAKWLGSVGIHASEIVFFRYLFGLIPVAVALYFGGTEGLRTKRPVAHFVRALLMCGALFLFFLGLSYIPLAEAIAIAFTAPLFITALSWPVLGERVGPHRWAAVLVGFLGMLIIVRPGSAAFQTEALIIIASAFVFAFAVLMTRRLTLTETNTGIFTYTTIISLVVMAPLAAVNWQPPTGFELAIMAGIGLVGGAAHFLVIVAYRHAPAAINATLEYSTLIWGTLWGWMLWREQPDAQTWVGAAIVVAAGLYITYRETRGGVPDLTSNTQRRPRT